MSKELTKGYYDEDLKFALTEQNKLKIEPSKFLEEIRKRMSLEYSWSKGIKSNKKNLLEDYLLKETHYALNAFFPTDDQENFPDVAGKAYPYFKRAIIRAFINRAIDFYESNGNNFFSTNQKDSVRNNLANLRGSLSKFLLPKIL